MAEHSIKIAILDFYLAKDGAQLTNDSSDTLQRYAGRFFFDNMQKDFYFQSLPSGAEERWDEACKALQEKQFDKAIDFLTAIPGVFKEFGFLQIPK